VNPSVRGRDSTIAEDDGVPIKVGDPPTGFFNEEQTGRHIPRPELPLIKPIEPARGDVRQTECGRAHAANRVCP